MLAFWQIPQILLNAKTNDVRVYFHHRDLFMSNLVIMGLDPGYQYTGYGIINYDGENSQALSYGDWDLRKKTIDLRLRTIFEHVCVLIDKFQPQAMAVEEVFMARNPSIAFKLGHARAAAIVAAATSDTHVVEYATRTVKQTITGVGTANKDQVAYMTRHLLSMSEHASNDATDALAIALCHAHHLECSDGAIAGSDQIHSELP